MTKTKLESIKELIKELGEEIEHYAEQPSITGLYGINATLSSISLKAEDLIVEYVED